jgi:hypothetical protein
MSVRQKTLLVIASVLLAIRYVAVPLLDWQANTRDELVVTTQRLERARDLMENRAAVESSLRQMDKSVATLRGRFPTKADSDSARLDFQREINDVLVSKGLTARVFDWIVETPVEGTNLYSLRARLSISGSMRALANAGAAVESRIPHAEIRELRFNSSTPVTLGADPAGDGSFVIDMTYLRAVAK